MNVLLAQSMTISSAKAMPAGPGRPGQSGRRIEHAAVGAANIAATDIAAHSDAGIKRVEQAGDASRLAAAGKRLDHQQAFGKSFDHRDPSVSIALMIPACFSFRDPEPVRQTLFRSFHPVNCHLP
jgi:hypothetical protein